MLTERHLLSCAHNVRKEPPEEYGAYLNDSTGVAAYSVTTLYSDGMVLLNHGVVFTFCTLRVADNFDHLVHCPFRGRWCVYPLCLLVRYLFCVTFTVGYHLVLVGVSLGSVPQDREKAKMVLMSIIACTCKSEL